ncbi:MAG TPA: type II secretion system protein GspG [Haliangium sp.]|nr:type II secretion system protein GspG [Haliangium sp.]
MRGAGSLRRGTIILGLLAAASLAWVSGCGRDQDRAAPAAGCASDKDCKGERICVQGACTDPPAAAPAPAAGPKPVKPQVKEFRMAVHKLSWYRSRYKLWNEQHPGACPGSLAEMVGGETEPKMHLDPWERPFVLKCGDTAPEGHPFGVLSLGPDGQEGTDDDLRSW